MSSRLCSLRAAAIASSASREAIRAFSRLISAAKSMITAHPDFKNSQAVISNSIAMPMQASGTSSTKIACFVKLAQAAVVWLGCSIAHLEAPAPIGALKHGETVLPFANAVRLGVGLMVIEYNREGNSKVSAPASRAVISMRFRYRGDSAIRQQESHAVVSGFRTRCPPDGSRDRGYRPRIFPRASFEHRRIDRERYLAANPQLEAEIAPL